MNRLAILVVLAAVSVAAGAGCRERAAGPVPAAAQGPDVLGQLPGLAATGDRRLLAELARITDENGTPERLLTPAIPDDRNVAAALSGLLPPGRARALLEQSDALVPAGRFRFSPIELEKAIRFRSRLARQHEQIRLALKRPSCDFGLRFDQGLRADLEFVDVVRLGARLEAFSAAESLAGGDFDGAIESLGRILRLAACLAGEKHPTPRLQATAVRREALALLGGICAHSKVTLEHLAQLDRLIQGHLAAWPPDALAWIGDRALGMYAYELVRAGRCAELLTEEEIARLKQQCILEEFPAAAARIVNQDELFYLEAMRKIVEACARPYHERIAVFQAIAADGKRKQREPDYPLVAVRLLLRDVQRGQQVQARDRACCEVWAVALAVALGRKPPGEAISPLSGKPYRVIRREERIEVRDGDADGAGDASAAVVRDLTPSGATHY
jgi:hypothetical protein